MLNRARDSQPHIELRRYGLSRRSYLSIDRQPFGIANWPRRCQVSAQCLRKFLSEREIIFAFDAATNGHDDVSFTKVDCLFHFLKRSFGSHANFTHLNGHFFYSRSTALRRLVRSIRSRLKGCENGRRTVRNNISIKLAKEDAAGERQRAVRRAGANAVADQSLF